jgi:hypothetical protein
MKHAVLLLICSTLLIFSTLQFCIKANCKEAKTAEAKNVALKNNGIKSGEAYQWPTYNPSLNYNFREEFPSLAMPTKDLDDCSNVVGTLSSGWWTFKWGPNKRSLVDSVGVMRLLNRMNTDFAYFRDSLGWPPDRRAKQGYRSAIYLYGSGLCTDNQDSNALGGWQSSIRYRDIDFPMVLASYYPIHCFSSNCTYSDKESQRSAMIHEGIHSVLADLPGCKQAAWFHEGGNTWLQQEADSKRTGDYSSMGFLNAASFLAPFMPIECYSGWLQDGSFGGPSAEGVNLYRDGKQVCTWRNLLGGVQYSNVFPTFLGMTLGKGSIAWIWRNCPARVLEGMAARLGEAQTRRLIAEYRAKQALVDMGPWTNAMLRLLNNSMGTKIKSEWAPYLENVDVWMASPYAKTTQEGKLLTPEQRTLPGWSGANQIPLKVEGSEVVIDFKPLSENMLCQICYRTENGTCIYSRPVSSGKCSLKLDQKPSNQVVIVVVSNTDYIYKGDATRYEKFDYRLELVKGVFAAADIHQKWYEWQKTF